MPPRNGCLALLQTSMGKGKGSAKAVAPLPVAGEANDALVAKQMHQLLAAIK